MYHLKLRQELLEKLAVHQHRQLLVYFIAIQDELVRGDIKGSNLLAETDIVYVVYEIVYVRENDVRMRLGVQHAAIIKNVFLQIL